MIRDIDHEIKVKNHLQIINQISNNFLKMCNFFASIQSKVDLLNSTLKSIKNPLIQEKFLEL